MSDCTIYQGGRIFDGTRLHQAKALVVEDGCIAGLMPETDAHVAPGQRVDLGGDILCPGFVDLQVNGGDGVMFNDAPGIDVLRRMAMAHRRLGATTILPTLITDTPAQTAAAIAATEAAIAAGVPGIGGLHLEGPHLAVTRKGAHDPSLIRPMGPDDLARLCDAATRLPTLLVTLAPESVTPDQVAALVKAGVVVSLGHTDADFDTCMAHVRAGATGVTHLFNAMSQMGSRAPGLVGAALDSGALWAGLIADGVHVHPATMGAAMAGKRGAGRIFLVSDAMAPAGTDMTEFHLNGRPIHRADGRLQLADGTLAGADLDLTTAIGTLVHRVGVGLETALAMATSLPARFADMPWTVGHLAQGACVPMLRLAQDQDRMRLVQVIDTDR